MHVEIETGAIEVVTIRGNLYHTAYPQGVLAWIELAVPGLPVTTIDARSFTVREVAWMPLPQDIV
jgi:hypothetical protein